MIDATLHWNTQTKLAPHILAQSHISPPHILAPHKISPITYYHFQLHLFLRSVCITKVSISAKNTEGVIQMLEIVNTTEVFVYPDTPTNTNDSEASEVLLTYDVYYVINLETAQTYDNRWLTDPISCYRTYKEISFAINPSSVHYVKLLSPSYGKKSEKNLQV